ncbi:DUF1684 domain-containing protein [Streptomyces sp. NPDC051940]|uniref:DUF1684 domain-containing protein n=1 Tax=Streptomyces sp. NPDC051940 TaxID=3155675 RepID=UPI00342022E7
MSADERAADAPGQWTAWHEDRLRRVTAPYGPLSVTGTLWLDDAVDGRLDDVPGRWRVDGDALVVQAEAGDGLTLDGEPFAGEVRLAVHEGGPGASRLAHRRCRLVPMRREGLWAVRVFDPEAKARTAFDGIDVFDHDARYTLPAVFRPYDAEQHVQVPNADGVARGIGLAGELVFTLDGQERTLKAGVEDGGGLFVVFADATSGRTSYRFRFQRTAAPAADGSVTVDFNRAQLPPCAFTSHFLCPFPPPGNRLDVAVPAGERDVASA